MSVEEKLKANKPDLYSWLAFTLQKTQELRVLKAALNEGRDSVAEELAASQAAADSRANSSEIHRADVAKRLADLPANADQRKSPFADRIKAQQAWLNLPLLPTTNIGSFPQTTEIRQARAAFKKGELSAADYEAAMKKEIALVVEEQEKLDLDVLVHGEAERNDMVEYFGELLSGFAFTQYGWVQSYGSRCVKPPIIFGDVSRPEAMTVALVYLRTKPDQTPDERHVDRPRNHPAMVFRPQRHSTLYRVQTNRTGSERRSIGSGKSRHQSHPNRRTCHP